MRDIGEVSALATTMTWDVDAGFEAAFVRDWHQVVRFALAATNDLDEAQDMAQDAYARLWARRHSIDWSRPVLPWLLVATRRLATDRFRKVRRLVRGEHVGGEVVDSTVRDRWLDVQAAMADLSQLERLALVLGHIAGYSTDDIATFLDTTPGAVRAAVSRGRRKLEDRT